MPQQSNSTRPGRRIVRWAVLVLLIVFVGIAVKEGRHHLIAKRFAVVVPGKIYRSGELESWPLRRVIEKYNIRTILTLLNDEPQDPDQQMEKVVAREMGVKLIRIGMPGNGCANFDLLEQAASVIGNEENYPLLVHCAAGVHRTGASLAVWRMNECGWTFEQALDDMIAHGYDVDRTPELKPHIKKYCEARLPPASQHAE